MNVDDIDLVLRTGRFQTVAAGGNPYTEVDFFFFSFFSSFSSFFSFLLSLFPFLFYSPSHPPSRTSTTKKSPNFSSIKEFSPPCLPTFFFLTLPFMIFTPLLRGGRGGMGSLILWRMLWGSLRLVLLGLLGFFFFRCFFFFSIFFFSIFFFSLFFFVPFSFLFFFVFLF